MGMNFFNFLLASVRQKPVKNRESRGNDSLKSISGILGLRAKNRTLGVQHAVEAGYVQSKLLFVLLFL